MKRMNDLSQDTLRCIMDNLLPFLFSQNEFKERAKFGPPTEDLKQGALVFDPRVYLKTGDVVGSLHRVESVSQSGHYCILSRTRRTLLWDKTWLRDWHLNEGKESAEEIAKRFSDTWVVTSRPCEDLFFICEDENWNGPRTTHFAGGLRMFAFGECLEKIGRERHFPVRLPPAPCVEVDQLKQGWDDKIPLACTHDAGDLDDWNEDNLADAAGNDLVENEEENEEDDVPSNDVYVCEDCDSTFNDLEEMKMHAYDEHFREAETQKRSKYGRKINPAPVYK